MKLKWYWPFPGQNACTGKEMKITRMFGIRWKLYASIHMWRIRYINYKWRIRYVSISLIRQPFFWLSLHITIFLISVDEQISIKHSSCFSFHIVSVKTHELIWHTFPLSKICVLDRISWLFCFFLFYFLQYI